MRRMKSPIFEVIRETAAGRYNASAMYQVTLREYYGLCLPPLAPPKSALSQFHGFAGGRVEDGSIHRLCGFWKTISNASSASSRTSIG